MLAPARPEITSGSPVSTIWAIAPFKMRFEVGLAKRVGCELQAIERGAVRRAPRRRWHR